MKKPVPTTKFAAIAAQIQREIFPEARQNDGRLPSELALAQRYETSAVTIGKALASLETRGLITRIAGIGTYLNDEPAAAGEALRSVGLAINYMEGHQDLAFYLARELQHAHYLPCLLDGSNAAGLTAFLKSGPSGLIVRGDSHFAYEALDHIAPETRLVFVSQFEGKHQYDASYVLYDHRSAGRQAVSHLLRLGRRRLVVCNFEMQPKWTSTLYWEGCQAAFREAGLEPVAQLLTEHPSPEQVDRLLNGPDRIDGVVAISDYRALDLVRGIARHGLRLPQDVAVIGGDDTDWAVHYDLTSVDAMGRELSVQAAAALEAGSRIFINIAPRLVFRGSCPAQ